MRVAVLSDVHGNLAAFEAALADARAQSPDQIILAGDYINGGPDSQACLHLALNSGLVALRGNHERYVCQ
ncbi:MAG TPA: metallophosphoesterase, partial [Anaerolineaceae bacterium]|nr:metallophosphoesterase [Anaerolineaceae bacterium]